MNEGRVGRSGRRLEDTATKGEDGNRLRPFEVSCGGEDGWQREARETSMGETRNGGARGEAPLNEGLKDTQEETSEIRGGR